MPTIGLNTGAFHPLAPKAPAGGATTVNDPLLTSTVSGILGLQSQKDIDEANAKAAQIQATGYGNEVGAYETASVITGVAGDVEKLQAQRKLAGTLGTQQAQVSASGFKEAGSSVDILKSSLQQGYLQQQLIDTQTAAEQSGFLAEASAARGAASAQTALSASYTAAAGRAAGSAADETAALTKYLGNTTLTDAEKLILAPLNGTSGTDAVNTLISGRGDGIGPAAGGTSPGGSTPQSTSYGTTSGYAPSSHIKIGGVDYATDASGRVIVRNKF